MKIFEQNTFMFVEDLLVGTMPYEHMKFNILKNDDNLISQKGVK